MRVELVAADIVTHGEHKVYIESLSNQGRVNWVFEHVSVPYKPCLEPGSEASEEATRKNKQGTGTESLAKHTKVPSWKAALLKLWWRRLLNLNRCPGLKP
jgi:hypothetical protein